ncbi:MAG TPA: alpha/beta fold hydrolase [Vicinamibacterales bacterium]
MRTKLSAAAAALMLLTLALTQGWVKTASTASTEAGLIVLADQGSFHVGGRPGQGEYVYVQYQIPPETRDLPLVMWPEDGGSQLWDTTPDGRDGFRNILVRRGFSTYVFDEPWHVRAAAGTPGVAPARRGGSGLAEVLTEADRRVFERFRIGVWPNYFPGVQFSRNAAALEQWWRQQTSQAAPSEAAESLDAEAAAYVAAALLAKVGPAVLLTHSENSILGWLTRMKTDEVKALVSYEATSFVFPEGDVPPPPTSSGPVRAVAVPSAEFAKLTTVPIQFVYGDNIPISPSNIPGLDIFRARFAMARKMVEAINARGGRAELLHLPAIGITGNTHIPMSDLNNVEIADLLSKWLNEKGLDRRGGGS